MGVVVVVGLSHIFFRTAHSDQYIHHDLPWQPGENSFEDGYMTGLTKLIEVLESCKL